MEFENKLEFCLVFEILFWVGFRLGELMVFILKDIFENKINIDKSYMKLNGEDIVFFFKIFKSKCIVFILSFLYNNIKDYLFKLYDLKEDERIFKFVKSYLYKELDRCCKLFGIKRIRVYDLRYFYVFLLVNMDVNILIIVECLGYEKVEIIWNIYFYLYLNK